MNAYLKSTGQRLWVLLYDWLAEKLAARLNVDARHLPQPYTLNDVVCWYLASRGRREEAYTRLRSILRETNFTVPPALRQLAQITDFDLFITTTFDPLLEQAINAERFGGATTAEVIAYSPNRVADLTVERDQQQRRRKETPLRVPRQLGARGVVGCGEVAVRAVRRRAEQRRDGDAGHGRDGRGERRQVNVSAKDHVEGSTHSQREGRGNKCRAAFCSKLCNPRRRCRRMRCVPWQDANPVAGGRSGDSRKEIAIVLCDATHAAERVADESKPIL